MWTRLMKRMQMMIMLDMNLYYMILIVDWCNLMQSLDIESFFLLASHHHKFLSRMTRRSK